MIFTAITLHNLFSYRGERRFDLSPDAERPGNLVLIQGRNTQGKTSFINAVKLLFMGPAEELRRQITTAKDRIPTVKQYIAGTEGWWGVMNDLAWKSGERECWIRAEWEDDNGTITAERCWKFDDQREFKESVYVDVPIEGSLLDDPARTFLERTLPRDFIPFFFFDGEEVRELAEGNNNQTIAKMELLLNIRPLDNVKEALKSLRTLWRKEAATKSRDSDFSEVRRRVEKLNEDIEIKQTQLEENNTDLKEAKDYLAQIERQLRVIQGGPHKEDSARLEERKQNAGNRRKELLNQFADQFLRDAFLRTCPELVDRVLKTAQQYAHGEAAGQTVLIDGLKRYLPDVFSKPPHSKPPLTSYQVNFYRDRLLKELEVYNPVTENEGSFHLDPNRARRLLAILTDYGSKALPAAALIRNIDQLGSLDSEIDELEKRLGNVSHLSRARQEEYDRLIEAKVKVNDQLLDLGTKQRTMENELRQIKESHTKATSQLNHAEQKLDESKAIQVQVDLIARLLEATERVKQALKKRKREELEEAYNLHFRQLFNSNSLIHRICIDEDFVISYRDQKDQAVPMASISAGMKQLSAMSLLWALKDVSGREIPILIDTPLARIDLHHQTNLLSDYYPKVGCQVIILPTDSELTPDKYARIAPYVYQYYELRNPTGKNTEIRKIPLHASSASVEAIHG